MKPSHPTKLPSTPTNSFIQMQPQKTPKFPSSSSITNITTLNTSIPVLQQQLRILKQEEKKYNKLASKLKDIQKQYKMLSEKQENEQYNVEKEVDQIDNIKRQIQQCIVQTKRLTNQTKQLQKQIVISQQQQNSLSIMLENVRNQNKQRRNQIKQKGIIYQQKNYQLETLHKQRDKCQIQIEKIKQQVERLVNEEYRLKKQVEIIQYEEMQEQKAIKKYQQLSEKLKIDCIEIQAKVSNMSKVLLGQEEKYRNIKQQIAIISSEENQLMQEIRRRQNLSKQNKEKIVRGKAKIQGLLQQIQSADQDLKLLTTQYSRQTDRLRQLQIRNNQLNLQFDQVSKDAKQIWQSLRETLEIAANNEDVWTLQNLTKLRNQALEIWNQIQQIMD